MNIVIRYDLITDVELNGSIAQFGHEVTTTIFSSVKGSSIIGGGCGSTLDVESSDCRSLTREHGLSDTPFATVEIEISGKVIFRQSTNSFPVWAG